MIVTRRGDTRWQNDWTPAAATPIDPGHDAECDAEPDVDLSSADTHDKPDEQSAPSSGDSTSALKADAPALKKALAQIASGDQAALSMLYDTTIARVYGLARRICVDPALAEEVAADVYLQVWRDARRFDAQRGTPLAWLLMITRSRALDALRRADKAITHPQPHLLRGETGDADESAAGPDVLLDALREHSAVRAAVSALPVRERQLVALAFFRGLTHAEIAQTTGQPLGTIKTMLRRALQMLRTQLQDGGIDRRGARFDDEVSDAC